MYVCVSEMGEGSVNEGRKKRLVPDKFRERGCNLCWCVVVFLAQHSLNDIHSLKLFSGMITFCSL